MAIGADAGTPAAPAEGAGGASSTGGTAARRHRRKVSRTITFTRYADAWVTARKDARDQDRSGVIEDLILGEMDRGGRRLTASELNDLAGHANAISLLLAPMRLTVRNPDHMRAMAEVDVALKQIGRLLRGAAEI